MKTILFLLFVMFTGSLFCPTIQQKGTEYEVSHVRRCLWGSETLAL